MLEINERPSGWCNDAELLFPPITPCPKMFIPLTVQEQWQQLKTFID